MNDEKQSTTQDKTPDLEAFEAATQKDLGTCIILHGFGDCRGRAW